MGAHELVIRLGRPFDVSVGGKYLEGTREVTVPFGDQASAEAAAREIEVTVRPVHDAGGEDYRQVVTGEVVQSAADARFAGDLAEAVGRHTGRMRDLRELEANSARPRKAVYCPGDLVITRMDYSQPGHPRRVHDDGTLCDHDGSVRIGDEPWDAGR